MGEAELINRVKVLEREVEALLGLHPEAMARLRPIELRETVYLVPEVRLLRVEDRPGGGFVYVYEDVCISEDNR